MSEATDTTPTTALAPFYKRTEFWLTLAALLFGAVLGSGLLGLDSMPAKILAMTVEMLAAVGYTVGRTVAKRPIVGGAPGYKTSEFWLTLASSGLLAFQSIDVLPQSTEAGGLLAALFTGAPGASYVAARSKLKATTGTMMLSLALLGALFVAGCSSWQTDTKTALDGFGAATKTYRTAVELTYNPKCDAASRVCAKEAPCPDYDACDSTRHALYLSMKAIHTARAAGYTAVSIGIKKDALDAVGKVSELIKRLVVALGKAGVQ